MAPLRAWLRVGFVLAVLTVSCLAGNSKLATTRNSQSQATSFGLTVFLHGIGNSGDHADPGDNSLSNKYPDTTSPNFTLYVFDTNSTQVATATGPLNYDPYNGYFSGVITIWSSLPAQLYELRVKTDKYLRASAGYIAISDGQSFYQAPPVTLVAGDVNNDNKISSDDYSALLNCYSDIAPPLSCTDPSAKTDADLNDDGSVNYVDYNLMIRELSVQPGGLAAYNRDAARSTKIASPGSTYPPVTLSLHTSPLHVQPGDTITLTVHLDIPTGSQWLLGVSHWITAVSLPLTFDPTVLQAISFQPVPGTGLQTIQSFIQGGVAELDAGIGYNSVQPILQSEDIATLTFKVIGGSSTSSSIAWQSCQPAPNGNCQGGATVLSEAFWDQAAQNVLGSAVGAAVCWQTCTQAVLSPTLDGAGWTNSAVTATLTAIDNTGGSGIAATYYALDNPACAPGSLASCSTYSSPLSVASEGRHTLYFFSADTAGNVEAQQSIPINIDETSPNPPAVRIDPAPNLAGWNDTDATVSFTSTGDAGAVQSGVTSCTPSSTLSFEQAGAIMSGTCIDAAGNSSFASSATVSIDKTPPDTMGTVSGVPTGWGAYFTPVTVTLTASDTLSGLANTVYQLDGGAPQTYGASFTIATSGAHTVTFYSTDVAGNVESTQSISLTSVSPTIVCSPTSGAFGQALTISGTNFSANEMVNIYADKIGPTPVYSATADSLGAFTLPATVQQGAYGPHTLIAVGSSGISATAPFTILSQTTLQKLSGGQGLRDSLSGYGFASNEAVKVYWG